MFLVRLGRAFGRFVSEPLLKSLTVEPDSFIFESASFLENRELFRFWLIAGLLAFILFSVVVVSIGVVAFLIFIVEVVLQIQQVVLVLVNSAEHAFKSDHEQVGGAAGPLVRQVVLPPYLFN